MEVKCTWYKQECVDSFEDQEVIVSEILRASVGKKMETLTVYLKNGTKIRFGVNKYFFDASGNLIKPTIYPVAGQWIKAEGVG